MSKKEFFSFSYDEVAEAIVEKVRGFLSDEEILNLYNKIFDEDLVDVNGLLYHTDDLRGLK